MDSRGSFECRLLAGFCSIWLLGILGLRLLGPFEGTRLMLFYALGTGLVGFGFMAAIRCHMEF